MGPAWITLFLLMASSEKGRLCIGAPEIVLSEGLCSETARRAIVVTPAGSERLFIWTGKNQEDVFTGTIPPKATSVSLEPDAYSVIELSIDGDPARGWPADTTLALRGGKQSWRWVVPAQDVVRLRRIHVPRARYVMGLNANRHQPFTRRAVEAIVPRVPLGELRLEPLPIVRGTVVDADDKPLAEAAVTFEDGSLCTTSNEQGAFACELAMGENRSLAVLVVTKSGYVSKELLFPARSTRDVDYGLVRLGVGHELTLKILRPEPRPVTVSLYRDYPVLTDHLLLRTVTLQEREEVATFDVDRGKHFVRVSGSAPLEQLEVPVNVVRAEDVEKTIEIEPYRLEGTVRFGEELVAEGQVELLPPGSTWRVPLPVRNGTFGATLWQRGALSAFVTGTGMGGEQDLVESPELGQDPSRWDIRIDKRMIAGRVYDAVTNKAVVTSIEVTAEVEGGPKHLSTRTKSDGTFQVLAPKPGTFNFRISNQEYAPVSADVSIAQDERVKTLDFALEPGVVQPIEIRTPSGSPVSNVSVLVGGQPGLVRPAFLIGARTDGSYALRGKPGATHLVYFLPQQGSFAVARVTLPRLGDPVRPLQVVILPPSSSLRVRIVNEKGEPAQADLLIRYNGEFVPRAILRQVTGPLPGAGRDGEVVLPRLPAGAYELWTVTAPQDEESLIAGNGTLRQPVRVGLSSGEGSVTVVAPPR
ncbi:MAG TPA: carboxypeptidase regulatory-like domain-containing protein [Thermoanaerobaculia bacterium]|nr:carboxypeptidase regulatory-like domain-containing protein [Thermoanaerobaculia bacterium]